MRINIIHKIMPDPEQIYALRIHCVALQQGHVLDFELFVEHLNPRAVVNLLSTCNFALIGDPFLVLFANTILPGKCIVSIGDLLLVCVQCLHDLQFKLCTNIIRTF